MRYIILSILVFTSILIKAQTATLDTSQIEIGDQINLTLKLDFRKGDKIVFPFFEKEIIEGVEIIKIFEPDTVNNGKTLQKKYTITSFEDSIFNIEPFSILKGNDTLKTNPIILRVTYPHKNIDSAFIEEIDTTQIFKIRASKPIMEAPLTFNEFWTRYGLWILIVLFTIILILLALHIYKRYKENRPIFMAPKPVIPPHIIAFENLNKLKEKRLAQQFKYKKYYTELTDILRIYIEKRFDIPAMEYVSSEIISAFENKNIISDKAFEKLRPILATADIVKFAKGQPLEHENELNFKNAFAFIELTKPVEVIEDNVEDIIEVDEIEELN